MHSEKQRTVRVRVRRSADSVVDLSNLQKNITSMSLILFRTSRPHAQCCTSESTLAGLPPRPSSALKNASPILSLRVNVQTLLKGREFCMSQGSNITAIAAHHSTKAICNPKHQSAIYPHNPPILRTHFKRYQRRDALL
jgi:hypothetical protein